MTRVPLLELEQKGEAMERRFEGMVALVTGSASGIGRATAQAFAREGAKLLLTDIQEAEGNALAESLRREGGAASFLRCDVSRPEEVEEMVARAMSEFGRLDLACNNAGIEGDQAATADCDEANWDHVIAVNLKSVWLCMKREIQAMLAGGGGAIVNMSSIAGLVGFPGLPAYVASKHGILGLTRTAALEYARQGIRVNAICPGVIHTPMVDRYVQGDAEKLRAMTANEPLGRLGRSEEIASAVLWLCSKESSFVTGHPLVVDGGWVAQ